MSDPTDPGRPHHGETGRRSHKTTATRIDTRRDLGPAHHQPPSSLPTTTGHSRAPDMDAETSHGPLRAGLDNPGGPHAVGDEQAPSGPTPATTAPTLYTPTQAAELLQVRESWLRRRAAQRRVPCTFLGKHLRFSPADLAQIIADGAARFPIASGPPIGAGAAGRRRSSRVDRPRRGVNPSADPADIQGRLNTHGLIFSAYRAWMWPCRQPARPHPRAHRRSTTMAWVEKHRGDYRVRYRLDDGTLLTENGFTTRNARQGPRRRHRVRPTPRPVRRPPPGEDHRSTSGSAPGPPRTTSPRSRARPTTPTSATTSCPAGRAPRSATSSGSRSRAGSTTSSAARWPTRAARTSWCCSP